MRTFLLWSSGESRSAAFGAACGDIGPGGESGFAAVGLCLSRFLGEMGFHFSDMIAPSDFKGIEASVFLISSWPGLKPLFFGEMFCYKLYIFSRPWTSCGFLSPLRIVDFICFWSSTLCRIHGLLFTSVCTVLRREGSRWPTSARENLLLILVPRCYVGAS